MDYILTGNPKAIGRILQENSIRVRKGEVKFIPVESTNVRCLIADDKYVSSASADGMDEKLSAMPVDEKKPRTRKKK